MRFYIITILFFLLINACAYDELPLCEINNPSFTECIKPIFTDNCVSCHNQQQPGGNLILETYYDISQAVKNGDVIDRILREYSDPLVMPLGSPKLSESEIQLIINWNENETPNN